MWKIHVQQVNRRQLNYFTTNLKKLRFANATYWWKTTCLLQADQTSFAKFCLWHWASSQITLKLLKRQLNAHLFRSHTSTLIYAHNLTVFSAGASQSPFSPSTVRPHRRRQSGRPFSSVQTVNSAGHKITENLHCNHRRQQQPTKHQLRLSSMCVCVFRQDLCTITQKGEEATFFEIDGKSASWDWTFLHR